MKTEHKKHSDLEKQKILTSIRDEFRLWGYDLSELTDEELEERILSISKNFSRTGVKIQEAAESMTKIIKLGFEL